MRRESDSFHRDKDEQGTIEDPGGEPLDRLLGEPLKISEVLRIAIALAGERVSAPRRPARNAALLAS